MTALTTPQPERETFTWLAWTWDVDKARAYAEAHCELQQVSVPGCAQFLGLVRINRDHVPTVDLSQPILLAWLPNADGQLPIDGWHRIARAHEKSLQTLPCWALTSAESERFIIHRRSR